MFDKAKNIVVSGGQFNGNVSEKKAGFKRLQRKVATSAFHNSAQRVDPPRCHENTRQAVLQELFRWIVQEEAVRTAWISWINGAAGAGKSAICQSIAEMCIAHGILVASFFFFRNDPTRSTIHPLIATLVYQIILLLPEIKDTIVDYIDEDPLIFERSLATQLDELIVKPLGSLQKSGRMLKLLLVIDGVDECQGDGNQRDLIRTFSRYLATNGSPVIVLFSSRAEKQLKSTFRWPQINRILLQLPLDDHYLPDADIRLFLEDKFTEIKETHSLSHLLDEDWPTDEVVQDIVDTSSGQFIYASVVINFVSLPRSHPAHQLEIVRGLRPSGLSTPFAHLDALYRHIFSQVQHLDETIKILAYRILGKESNVTEIATFFDMPKANILVDMSDLESVIVCNDRRIRFLHASLPDFLLDQTRSRVYYINASTWCTRLSLIWYKNAASGRFSDFSNISLAQLLHQAESTPSLRESILKFDPHILGEFTLGFYVDYLTAIQRLNFPDDGKVYRHQLNLVTRYLRVRKNIPSDKLHTVLKKHNIVGILAEVDREEAKKAKGSRRTWVKAQFTRLLRRS